MTILKKQFSLGHTHTHNFYTWSRLNMLNEKKKLEGNLMLRGKNVAM